MNDNVTDNTKKSKGILGRLNLDKPRPTLWSIGAYLSIALNGILLIIILVLGTQLFVLKDLVQNQLVGGLYYSFYLMDEASIDTTIQVQDTIPIGFDLTINQTTVVVLTEDTLIEGARVTLSTGGLNIVQAPTDITLPAGTRLPIQLNLVVPVNTTVPISLNVPVHIPLNQTELHTPFQLLQEVVSPYYDCLSGLPNSWLEIFKIFGALPTCTSILP